MSYKTADHQLERWILWRLTERPDEIPLAALEARDFTVRPLAEWYDEIAKRQADGEPIEGIDQLLALDIVPGEELQASLACETDWSNFWSMRDVESRSQFLWRCSWLRRLRYRRELVGVSKRLAEAAEGGEDDLTAFTQEDDYLARLKDRIQPPERVDPIEQLRQGLKRERVPLGFSTIDVRIGGIPRGGVAFLLARPGVGKSTLASNIALSVCEAFPAEDVVIASLEQPADEFVGKMMQAYFCIRRDEVPRMISGERVNSGFGGRTLEDFERISSRLHVWDSTRTMDQIEQRVSMLDGPVALVVIDYVQRVKASGARFRSKYELVTDTVERCRPLAVALRTAVLGISQCSRSAERDKPPSISDARDTGAIEEEGDVVLGLYRPDWAKEQEKEKRMADLRVAILKQKWGYGGGVMLDFDLPFQRITEPQQQGEIPV